MIYLIEKESWKMKGIFLNLLSVNKWLEDEKLDKKNFYLTEDLDMKYISRIVYVDGKCIYNNKQFWKIDVYKDNILENFEEHEVLDFMGLPVYKDRFEIELNSNITRLTEIDGLAGEVEYNINVGNEFISLFREECVKTDFKSITPLEIAQKLAPIISLVQTGSFREAKQVLQTIENDDFLTPERIQKYIAMMEAADVIEYATEEEFFYTAQENV